MKSPTGIHEKKTLQKINQHGVTCMYYSGFAWMFWMPEVNVKKEENKDQLAKTTGHQLQLTTNYCHSHLKVYPASVILRVNSVGF